MRLIITEEERQHIQELNAKYKKSPFYTAKSFDMGDELGNYKFDERADKYTEELSSVFENLAKKEGRIVVKKTLENLLQKYDKRQED
jgi:hypothetical protein